MCVGGGHLGYGAFCQRTSHRRTGISFNSQQNYALVNGNSPMLKRMHTYARTVKKIYALPKCTQCVTDSDAQWPAAATTNCWMIVSTPCVPVPCVSWSWTSCYRTSLPFDLIHLDSWLWLLAWTSDLLLLDPQHILPVPAAIWWSALQTTTTGNPCFFWHCIPCTTSRGVLYLAARGALSALRSLTRYMTLPLSYWWFFQELGPLGKK